MKMDKEAMAKVNEILKANGRRELSMEETEMVNGGGTFRTGIGPKNGNFGGLCQTIVGSDGETHFFIALPDQMYKPNAVYIEVDEEAFHNIYMTYRSLYPMDEELGRDHKASYKLYE